MTEQPIEQPTPAEVDDQPHSGDLADDTDGTVNEPAIDDTDADAADVPALEPPEELKGWG